MTLFESRPVFLIVGCAFAYALSTFALKQAADAPHPAIYLVIAACFGGAAFAEILILRQMDLGLAYIAIIATESLLILGVALIIGEGLSPREMAGAVLIVTGTAILGS